MGNCRLGVSFGQQSFLYSFPAGNPMNSSRLAAFAEIVEEHRRLGGGYTVMDPVSASEHELLVFHTQAYIDRVREASATGRGELGSEDTPAFQGVYEASLFPVGSTLRGLELIMGGEFDHFFNPVGGLHHSAPDEARGFCVFNDSVIAMSRALNEYRLRSVAYVDIDAHHGDGVYYEFEPDPRVIVGDIHEHGRFLYPGTGDETETGKGFAVGTKMNLGLLPGSGDKEFFQAFDRVEEFLRKSKPEMIFFQCGADGLAGDPITDLNYSGAAHAYAAKRLHTLAHEMCGGRILAMGGGGYSSENVARAWKAVVEELSGEDGP
ncbi:MAG TPA: acetoin utilization protein AcuC [Nitrososphaerales archaeon]|nr:acetoin utilization protein AcuC [Nitrososphaerales archaeon]